MTNNIQWKLRLLSTYFGMKLQNMHANTSEIYSHTNTVYIISFPNQRSNYLFYVISMMHTVTEGN